MIKISPFLKKSQSATDFLISYGWAILIVLVAVGATTYFRVLGQAYLIPEKCVIAKGTGLLCEDFSAYGGMIVLRVKNTLAQEIEILTASVSKDGNSCSLLSTKKIPAGSSKNLELATGPTCLNLATAGTKLNGDISITFQKENLGITTRGDVSISTVETGSFFNCDEITKCSDYIDSTNCTNDVCKIGNCEWKVTICVKCGDGNCEAEENCPKDNVSCSDTKCYEPTCITGCGQVAVSARGTDEACYNNVGCSGTSCFCNGAGSCVDCIDNSDCAGYYICQNGICTFPNDYVSWWKFENNVLDFAGRNNGVFYGGSADYITGKSGLAINLDGSDDYIKVAHHSSLEPVDELTYAAWIYRKGGNFNTIIQKNDESRSPYYYKRLHINYGKLKFYVYNGSTIMYDSPYSINPNGWYHIAVSIDEDSYVKMYVDGVEIYSNTTKVGNLLKADDEPLTIGTRLNAGSPGWFFYGTIDEVMIYNRSLSETEIQQIYCSQGGTAVFCPPP